MAATPDELTKLPENWDGYSGSPVTQKNCDMARVIAGALAGSIRITPQFIPGSGGEIQIEYHAGGIDIEIWIDCKEAP